MASFRALTPGVSTARPAPWGAHARMPERGASMAGRFYAEGCLRAFHSPSPSALIPVLSISKCSGPDEPRYGMLTGNVLCRRHKVLKSGMGHSRPVKANRLSTKPVVCRKGKPNSTLIVRQAWIAASL